MSDHDHRELAEVLNGISGRAVVSGYRSPLYNRLFASWNRIDAQPKFSQTAKGLRRESVWVNF